MKSRSESLTPELTTYITEALHELDRIPADRRARLGRLVSFVSERLGQGLSAKLIFICTHNSRRSHIAQIWAQTAAHYFIVPGVETYSGGTQSTAFNPRAVSAVRRAGFSVDDSEEGGNPVYRVRFEHTVPPMRCFSKVYDEAPNPQQGFAAVMTCSEADRACPLVLGAAERISIPFDDPKAFDGTDQEDQRYDERCRQIAREMLYTLQAIATP